MTLRFWYSLAARFGVGVMARLVRPIVVFSGLGVIALRFGGEMFVTDEASDW
jgi:hypothetical protein